MDSLDVMDANYQRKYDDAQKRQDKLFDQQGKLEQSIKETMSKLRSVQLGQASANDALEYLSYFGQALKGIQNDAKKRFYATFIDHIEIYENADWKNGEDIVKKIRFKISLMYGGKQTFELTHLEDEKGKPTQKIVKAENFRVKENTDETVCLMSRVKD